MAWRFETRFLAGPMLKAATTPVSAHNAAARPRLAAQPSLTPARRSRKLFGENLCKRVSSKHERQRPRVRYHQTMGAADTTA